MLTLSYKFMIELLTDPKFIEVGKRERIHCEIDVSVDGIPSVNVGITSVQN